MKDEHAAHQESIQDLGEGNSAAWSIREDRSRGGPRDREIVPAGERDHRRGELHLPEGHDLGKDCVVLIAAGNNRGAHDSIYNLDVVLPGWPARATSSRRGGEPRRSGTAFEKGPQRGGPSVRPSPSLI